MKHAKDVKRLFERVNCLLDMMPKNNPCIFWKPCYDEKGGYMSELTAEEKLKKLESLFCEIRRCAQKEWAADGHDFTVTICAEYWAEIKDII